MVFPKPYLQGKIKEAVEMGCLTNEESTKVLILSGSHGNEDGYSALSDITQLKDLNDSDEGSVTTTFYENDCQRQAFLNFLSCTKNHYHFFLVPKITTNFLITYAVVIFFEKCIFSWDFS